MSLQFVKSESLESIADTIRAKYAGYPIPDNCNQVEYIRCNKGISTSATGNNQGHYYNTNILPTPTLSFEIKFKIYCGYNSNQIQTSSPGAYGCILGSRSSSGVSEYQLTTYTESSSLPKGCFRYGQGNGPQQNNNAYLNPDINQLQECSFYQQGSEMVYQGPYGNKSFSVLTANPINSYPVSLFALNNANTVTQFGDVAIYDLKFYDTEDGIKKLKYHYIPVVNDKDKWFGFYDIINGAPLRIYYNDYGVDTTLESLQTNGFIGSTIEKTNIGKLKFPDQFNFYINKLNADFPKLYAPSGAVSDDKLLITDNVNNGSFTEEFKVSLFDKGILYTSLNIPKINGTNDAVFNLDNLQLIGSINCLIESTAEKFLNSSYSNSIELPFKNFQWVLPQPYSNYIVSQQISISTGHYGIDWVLPNGAIGGQPIKPALAGTVIDKSANDADTASTAGYYITINHGLQNDGFYYATRYQHMAAQSKYNIGDNVILDSIIGNVGTSGTASTGYHLHFEVYKSGYELDTAAKVRAVRNPASTILQDPSKFHYILR